MIQQFFPKSVLISAPFFLVLSYGLSTSASSIADIHIEQGKVVFRNASGKEYSYQHPDHRKFHAPMQSKAKLVFSPGTVARIVCPDGSELPISVASSPARQRTLEVVVECKFNDVGKGDKFQTDKSQDIVEGLQGQRSPLYIVSPRFSVLENTHPIIRWYSSDPINTKYYQLILFKDLKQIEVVSISLEKIRRNQMAQYLSYEVDYPFQEAIRSDHEYKIFLVDDKTNLNDPKVKESIQKKRNTFPAFRLAPLTTKKVIQGVRTQLEENNDRYERDFQMATTLGQMGLYSSAIDLLENLLKDGYNDPSISGYLNYYYKRIGLVSISKSFKSDFPPLETNK
jgi:hypothetical protein